MPVAVFVARPFGGPGMGVSVAAVYGEAYAQTDCKRRNQNDGDAYRNSDFKFFSHYFIFPLIPNLAGKRARVRRARLPLSYLNFLLIIYINMAIKKSLAAIYCGKTICAPKERAHIPFLPRLSAVKNSTNALKSEEYYAQCFYPRR